GNEMENKIPLSVAIAERRKCLREMARMAADAAERTRQAQVEREKHAGDLVVEWLSTEYDFDAYELTENVELMEDSNQNDYLITIRFPNGKVTLQNWFSVDSKRPKESDYPYWKASFDGTTCNYQNFFDAAYYAMNGRSIESPR